MLGWIGRVIRVQEKRELHAETLLYFAFFVGTMRLLLEYFLVGFNAQPLFRTFLLYVSWYWLCIFAFGLPVRLFAPPPWQGRINVMLVGLFLGFLPPVLDFMAVGWGGALMSGEGFGYRYIADFPSGWPLLMFGEDRGVPFGEGFILWSAVFFTAAYMWVRTRNPRRTLAAGLLSYLVCMTLGAVMPTLTLKLRETLELQTGFGEVLIYVQIGFALGLYLLAYRPQLLAHLGRRALHAAPLVALSAVGYAFIQPVDGAFVGVALLIALGGAMTIAQNDHWDDLEEEREGEERVTRVDMLVLVISFGLVTATLIEESQLVAMPVILYGVASYLYNAPLYRGKRYLPANLKLEGIWGGSAFLMGMIYAAQPLQQAAYYDPTSPGFRVGTSMTPLAALWGAELPIAAFLAFGGWSLLAALKDEKDVEADAKLGVQTVYTVALKRGVPPARVSRVLRPVAALSNLIAAWLPFVAGLVPLSASIAMTVLGAAAALRLHRDAKVDFQLTLAALTALLATLAWGISTGA